MSLKCPTCGGQVVYDPKQAKIVCKFCEGKTSTEDFSTLAGRETYDKENIQPEKIKRPSYAPWQEPVQEVEPEPAVDEFMETNIYHCKSCGADLMLTGTEASTFCSYCGSPTIVFDRVSKELRPKWIIPFKLSEEQALKSIKEHFADRSYLPKKIKELTVDKVRAIYIPYWLFTTNIRRSMVVEASTNDDGTFQYVRDASCCYNKVTMDASMRMNNEMSRRLEPYNVSELKEFDVAYLSGFYADKYDVPKEALVSANVQRCRDYLDDAILDSCPHVSRVTVGSTTSINYKMKNVQEEYRVEDIEYALLPAYFVNLKYETGRQLVIVNGQTGKVVGNLPVEKNRIVKMFIKNALIACPVFIIFACIIAYVPQIWPISIILAAITGIMIVGGISSYKEYIQGRQRILSGSMASYVNNREDNTW